MAAFTSYTQRTQRLIQTISSSSSTLIPAILGNRPPAVIQENRGSPTKPFSNCQQNGYYSDPKNCAAYYICKNGLNYHLSCGNNLMFNPLNGKCDQVNQQKCRPGEQIYIPSNLKDVVVNVRSEQVKEKLKDNPAKVIHLK